jgi:nicotinamidase-related amidase
MKNLGILLIDMQEHWINSSLPKEIENLIDAQKRLFNFVLERQIPIFVLEYIDSGKTIKELTQALSKNKTYFIPKYEDNGFIIDGLFSAPDSLKEEYQNQELKKILEKEEIKKLILTGITKDACVLETAKGAKKRNYPIFTAEELMNMNKFKVEWFYNNSNHYKTLTELLNGISQD